jgi:phosphorylated CTD-interacting factor 1
MCGVSTAHSGTPGGIKRRAPSGEQIGSPPIKKFILTGPWDLEVPSNVMSLLSPQPQSHLLPSHPEAEFFRSGLVAKLRQCYQQSCFSREGINSPKESLSRWMIEQKISDLRGADPIFPSCNSSEGVISPQMFKEIMNDIPMKIVKPRFTGDARKQLAKFAEACKRAVETRNATAEARKIVKWKAEETFNWLRATTGGNYESFQERIAHLKTTCQPHVHAAAKSSVEGICRKISVLAKQYAQMARETHLNLFAESSVKVEEPERGKFRCQPALCGPYQFVENSKMPQIEFLQDREHTLLKFRTDTVRITTQYLQKLEQLYRYNCVDDRKFDFFLARSYSLLRRYNAYCEDFAAPLSTQSSLPVPVFESIQRNFGVTFECFSSPLNCYFRQFCSAFPDTDGYFGSRGTFLDYHPVSGSFQMNPPFSDQLIDATITHMEELLASSREPLSFILFLPEPADEADGIESGEVADDTWLKRLENSRWKRKKIIIPAFEHEYRHGAQHIVSKNEASVRSPCATLIFWLQNESGFEEWSPTDEKVDALIDAYRPGRERERDRQDLLSPERQNPHQADKAVAAAAAAACATE